MHRNSPSLADEMLQDPELMLKWIASIIVVDELPEEAMNGDIVRTEKDIYIYAEDKWLKL